MAIIYAKSESVWDHFKELITEIIDKYGLKKICDAGGGANPLLSLDDIKARGIEYTVLDISAGELDKLPEGYRKVVRDLTSVENSFWEQFDLIFTKMLAEHVTNGELLHKNIYKMLKKGGMVVHFFPTLYAPPFILNKLMSEGISRIFLNFFAPRNNILHSKFPAHYNWCRGPTKKMQQRLQRLGYDIVEYRGLFGHSGYYRRLPFLVQIHEHLVNLLLKHPVPACTSYAFVVLAKPGDVTG
jgi:uncharacterized UPF0146 family protein